MNNEVARTKKVMVIDDDQIYRELLSIALRGAGYETVSAENGAKALAMLEEAKPDALLVDMLMPVMDGLRFLHALRDEAKVTTPALVLTCMDSKAFVIDALLAGAKDVLTKPVDLDVLLGKLAALC